jgi:hypothetical protein
MILKEKGYKIRITPKITIRTQYPNTIKKAMRRKYFWGGGLANIIDKTRFRIGFIIRPAYFLALIMSILLNIITVFISRIYFLTSIAITASILIIPTLIILMMSIIWIIKNSKTKYIKSIPYMTFLPLVQEFSYFIGFVRVMFGKRLQNAWR